LTGAPLRVETHGFLGGFVMWVMTTKFHDAVLLAITSGVGADSIDMSGAWIGLTNGPLTPTPQTQLAAVIALEATYPGYARQTLSAVTAPFTGPGSLELVEWSRMTFRPSSDSAPNVIYSQFMTSSDSLTLWGVEVFNEPIPLTDPSTQLTDVARFGYDPAANYGLSLVSP
jgi:hypothetical protein